MGASWIMNKSKPTWLEAADEFTSLFLCVCIVASILIVLVLIVFPTKIKLLLSGCGCGDICPDFCHVSHIAATVFASLLFRPRCCLACAALVTGRLIYLGPHVALEELLWQCSVESLRMRS